MIEIKNLSRIYRDKNNHTVYALNDISLKLPKTGMIFILGKSGSGKTTLLNMISGLDKYDKGDILVQGKSFSNFNDTDFDSYRNTMVGFIFQDYQLLDGLSVAENIEVSLQLQGQKNKNEKINNVLKEVDLIGYNHRRINELSGGEKQRVSIARAMIKEPKIIMADEPSGALDSKTGEQIFQTLKKISNDRLVLIVSHEREFADTYGDRIIELNDGKIISDIERKQETNFFVDTKQDDIKIDESPYLPVKTKVSFNFLVKMALLNLNHRKIRLLFSILLTAVAFMIFAISNTLGSFNKDDVAIETFKKINNQTIALSKEIKNESSEIREESRITREEYETLLSKYDEYKFLPVYSYRNKSKYSINKLFYRDGADFDHKLQSDRYHTFNIQGFTYLNSDELAKSFNMALIAGEWASNDKHVVITKYIAESFLTYGLKESIQSNQGIQIKTYQDLIGKKLFNKVISGIVDTHLDSKYKVLTHFIQGDNPYLMNRELLQITETGIHSMAFLMPDSTPLINFFDFNDEVEYVFSEGELDLRFTRFIGLEEISDENIYYMENKNSISELSESEYLISYRTIKDILSDLFQEKNPQLSDYFYDDFINAKDIYLKNEYKLPIENIKKSDTYMKHYNDYQHHNDDQIYENMVSLAFKGHSIDSVDLFDFMTNLYDEKLEMTWFKKNYSYDELIYETHIYDYMNNQCNIYNEVNNTSYTYEEYLKMFRSEDYIYEYADRVMSEYYSKELMLNKFNVSDKYEYLTDTKIKQFLKRFHGKLEVEYQGQKMMINNKKISGIFKPTVFNHHGDLIGKADPFYDASFDNDDTFAFLIGSIPKNNRQNKALLKEHYNLDADTHFVIRHETIVLLEEANSVMLVLKNPLIYVSIGFALFAVLLLINYVSLNIEYKKKDIGILRALGAKTSDIISIFMKEGIIISFINSVLSIIFFAIAIVIFNQYLEKYHQMYIAILYMDFRQVLLIVTISLIISFMVVFVLVKKITGVKPTDIIKNK